jgi:hypothetical protein
MRRVLSGVPATMGVDADGVSRRREGYIWDATPPEPFQAPQARRVRSASGASRITVRVTQGVLDDVNRNGPKRAMISVRGVEGATSTAHRKLTLTIDDEYALVLGDTYAFHGLSDREPLSPLPVSRSPPLPSQASRPPPPYAESFKHTASSLSSLSAASSPLVNASDSLLRLVSLMSGDSL